MFKARIRKVNDTLMLPLSPELLKALESEVGEGDTLYLEPTGNGELKLRTSGPEMERLLAAEMAVVNRNHEILAGLA